MKGNTIIKKKAMRSYRDEFVQFIFVYLSVFKACTECLRQK